MISYNWRLNIATMLFFTFVQVVVPLIPRYAVSIGMQPFIIGVATSSVSISAILSRPIGGILSDRGSRRNLMVAGVALVSTSYVLLSLSRDVSTIVASRILEGVAVALFVPSSIASAIDYAPEGRVGEALGWRSLTIGVGFSLGPALGGFMSEVFGYNDTFMLAAVLVLITIPLVASCKEKVRIHNTKTTRMYLIELRRPHFILALTSLIIYSLAWTGLLTFLSAYLKIQGFGDIEIGLFMAIQAAVSLVFRVFAGRFSDVKPYLATTIGLFVISASFSAIYFFEEPPLLYIASLVYGLGVGIYVPASQTLALAKASAESRGLLSSIYTMGLDLGNLSGPTFFGFLIESFKSFNIVFLVAPFLPFMSALTLLLHAIKNELR
ncbi:MAG: MFS transporter [Candidatus Nezhaarchaeales archaeon]